MLVPSIVREEIIAGKLFPQDWTKIQAGVPRLEVHEAQVGDSALQYILDAGEAAVLELAHQQQVSLGLMDERKGRKVAVELFGVEVLGTVGLLVRAKREGLIPTVAESIRRMQSREYHTHERIVSQVLRMVGECA